MNIASERYVEKDVETYYALPKRIGDIPAEELLEIAKLHDKQADTIQNAGSIYFQKIAASSYIEAAILSNDPEYVHLEDNLNNLNKAAELLNSAAQGEYGLLEKGFDLSHRQFTWLRTELQLDFIDVYKDIACGLVTDRTKHEILQKIDQRTAYAKGVDASHAKGGYLYELKALKNVWQHYQHDGDAIAFPSTFRGGSGDYFPEDTHDIVLANRREEGWNFTGIEIKGGEGLKPAHLSRYRHPIMHIGKDESVTMYDAIKQYGQQKIAS